MIETAFIKTFTTLSQIFVPSFLQVLPYTFSIIPKVGRPFVSCSPFRFICHVYLIFDFVLFSEFI